ncbi:MAG: phosphoribosylformylglycinamidine synthase subunit PurL [Patescibacteria group bacterium]
MTHRIEIGFRSYDARSARMAESLQKHTGQLPVRLRVLDVYSLTLPLSAEQLAQAAALLANPVIQEYRIDTPLQLSDVDWAIEIGFLPGVTDNVGSTATETIVDSIGSSFSEKERIYSSQLILIFGTYTLKQIEEFAATQYNPLIQRMVLKSGKQYSQDNGMETEVPEVHLTSQGTVTTVSLDVSDEELATIGKLGIQNQDGSRRGPLALDCTYMQAIRDYFRSENRQPTDIELETLAQTWSEHCKHTIFADPIDEIADGLFKHYIRRATFDVIAQRRQLNPNDDFCVSVFTDNSGAVTFTEDYLITDKVETHNTPSALDPFGGALTGIVGVNRDALGFGLGAKPIINRYGYCFAPRSTQRQLYRDRDLSTPMLSPERIMDGVIEGVNVGGNCSGIPTALGFMLFDERYQGKPLVFVGTVGLIPRAHQRNRAGKSERLEHNTHEKQAKVGDYIVMIGGRVGLDGIHGATFSSEDLDEGSPATAVQIGDPITQKKLSDAIVKEARDRGLFNSITDNGAGGLSSSVGEMARDTNGCCVELEKVPVKYPGLAPWQIWISESQERMTLAVSPEHWEAFHSLMKRRGVEATVIGTFTSSGRCEVLYKGETIMDIAMEFLHNGLPPRPLQTSKPHFKLQEPQLYLPSDLSEELLSLLGRPTLASNEFISQQYDHEVQAGSVLKPLQGVGRVNGESAVVRPLLNEQAGVALSHGIYPRYSEIDTYYMAAACVDTAVRNLISVGADPDRIALLDNFCWCSSNDPERLYELKRAVEACYDYAVAYNTPYISGKDSMFNDFKGYDEVGNQVVISIPPTLLISSIGIVNDIRRVISIDAKQPGDVIYLLGDTDDEMGGSEYFAMFDEVGVSIPHVDGAANMSRYRAVARAIQDGLVASSISLTKGGLGIALAKMAMAGRRGISIDLDEVAGSWLRADNALFSESQGRILVAVPEANVQLFEKTMSGHSCSRLGQVTETEDLVVTHDADVIISTTVDAMLRSYRGTFH